MDKILSDVTHRTKQSFDHGADVYNYGNLQRSFIPLSPYVNDNDNL